MWQSFGSSNSDNILDFCGMIIIIQKPFVKNNTNNDKKTKEKQSIICEIDKKILKCNKKQKYNKEIDDVSLTLSILSEGLSFSTVERLFAKNNISICNERKFYRYLKKISPKIIQISKNICYQNFEQMEDNSILSFDCPWVHSRKSSQSFGSVINIMTDKVVGWEVIENDELSPQRLESEVLFHLKDLYKNQKVTGHVKDGDLMTLNFY